jgi:hypothetical protein
MPDRVKLTIRAQLYLRCIDDWKAPFEVAALLGDTPPPHLGIVRRMLCRLVNGGYAEHHYGNDTFRQTDAGRALLASNAKTGE